MNAEIIAIGSELLLGQVVNTNAVWLSQRLAEIGVSVIYHTSVGDNPERIEKALKLAVERVDLVFTTGGLGPTEDDITIAILAKAFNQPLVEYPAAKAQIDGFFRRLQRKPIPSSYRMALLPEGAAMIPNPVGTAPGVIFKAGKTTIFTFPGVPKEMEAMYQGTVKGYLQGLSKGVILSRTLWFSGIPEASLGEKVADLMAGKNPTVGILASWGMVRLRITCLADTEEAARSLIRPVEEEILKRASEYHFGYDEDTLEKVVGELLRERKMTLAIAESCTGGLIAKRITDIPGSSDYFVEGLVTYANEAKTKLLGISEELLKEHGAVSEEAAEAMAEGVKRAAGTDYGLSVTGIAGPGGGTAEKPVGLIYIGISGPKGTQVHKYIMGSHFPRDVLRERTAMTALNLLRLAILEKPVPPLI